MCFLHCQAIERDITEALPYKICIFSALFNMCFHILLILCSCYKTAIYKLCFYSLSKKIEININICNTNRTITKDFKSSTNFIDLGSTVKSDIKWYVTQSHWWRWGCFGVMYLTNEWFRMVNLYAIFRTHNYNVKRYINCLFRNIHSWKIW
jgi:hypothetical protein